jgi:hypothetical protein
MKSGTNYDGEDTNIIKNGFLAQPSHFIQFCNIIPRNGRFGKGNFKKFLVGKRERKKLGVVEQDCRRRGNYVDIFRSIK